MKKIIIDRRRIFFDDENIFGNLPDNKPITQYTKDSLIEKALKDRKGINNLQSNILHRRKRK